MNKIVDWNPQALWNWRSFNGLPRDPSRSAESASKSKLTCSLCFETFDVRSDLETHSILAHSQSLLQCSSVGCDFRTTDPSILENHQKEKHHNLKDAPTSSAKLNPQEIVCWQCGCEFADENSLQTHTGIYHQNSTGETLTDPRYPYRCALCGYVSATQRMMMEHMKLHSGRLLLCRAGEECSFCTPLESVLREHVQKEHDDDDDGVTHCPHCAQPCSTHHSFVHHYREYHHKGLCQLCSKVEQKYFKMQANTEHGKSSFSVLSELHQPSSQGTSKVAVENLQTESQSSNNGRRTRKQPRPRKLVHLSSSTDTLPSTDITTGDVQSNKIALARKDFLAKYTVKMQRFMESPLLGCKLCQKPLFFRQKKNFLIHALCHRKPIHGCKKCKLYFRYYYQLLLHRRKLHCQRKEATKR